MLVKPCGYDNFGARSSPASFCKDYKSIPPSAKSVGELALQHYDKWIETDINLVSPNYITNFNLGKVKKV